jgi:serine/threonine-protein kinase PpkA
VAPLSIEGYRVEAELAAGTGPRLLAARQLMLDQPVLLMLAPASGDLQATMRQQALLRHPGVATVLDIGETGEGLAYVALAAPSGPSLRQRLREGIELDDSLLLLRRLLAVLQHIESRALPGARVDPERVYFDAQGRPVLLQLAGATPAEQLRDLGAVLFEALSGHPPAAEAPRLPDYLARWQPLIDACLGATPLASLAELSGVLDQLQGRPPAPVLPSSAVATGGPADPSTPTVSSANAPPSPRPPHESASPTATEKAVPRQAEPSAAPAAAASERSTVIRPARPRPSATTAESPAAAVRAPAVAKSSTPAAAQPRPAKAASEGSGGADDLLRVTAPSKRMEPSAAFETARLPSRSDTPPPPSRLPLYIAAAVGLPVLGLLLWWLLAGGAPDPSAEAGPAVARSTLPSPPALPTAPIAAAPAESATYQPPDPATDWDPEASAVLEPELALDALPTVEDPVERFLLFARTNVEAGRLTSPPGRNALDRYLLALRIEPDNRQAQVGLTDLASLCLRLASEAGQLDEKLGQLACVDRVARAHPVVAGVAAQAAQLRQAELDRRLQDGRQALAEWRSADAARLFAEALQISPQQAEAVAGADEAARQGRPGYRFRDSLGEAGAGPEMVVAAGLAWARSETRVDEFRRYWQAAGRARFGGELPSCRDRESLLRSSRRRSWESPDFPQGDTHPVVCVNVAMAEHYAEWLSGQSGHRYRLPRASEWSALAGSAPTECRANFRDQAAVRAWKARDAAACDDGHGHTAPVDALPAQSGLFGLYGNVAEWLQDCENANCRQRLAAGGSWFSSAAESAPAGFAAEPGFTTIGFRVVRELPEGR